MTRSELRRRRDGAVLLNTKRPNDTEYLVMCPVRGDFRVFALAPQWAIARVDAHTDDGRAYEGVRVAWSL